MQSQIISWKGATTGLALAALLAVSGCSHYATVAEREPQFHSDRPVPAKIELSITKATRREKREPLIAIGDLLVAARDAADQLARDPKDEAARNAYNFAVARVFSVIKHAHLDPWTQPLRVPAEGGEFVLAHKPDARKGWSPALYDFTPADQFDVHGSYVTKRTTREGIGAPVVAVGKELNKSAAVDYTIPRIYYGVTAVIHFEGRRAVVEFKDPLAAETVSLGGRVYPLAADFTVPLAVLLASTDTNKLELSRLLHPGKYAETARICRLQPFDPNKTVVLVIHGLMDSPATWTPMLNTLRDDPEIRKKYQFWFYSYPSGYPYPYSAGILRRELDAIQKRYPLRKPMVVIGHSMGGCISRLLITDTGEKLWRDLFKKAPSETELSPESRALFSDALIFQHRREIGRVIFMAAPLRGADLAENWLGRFGSMLVKSPSTLLKAGHDALKIATFQGDELRMSRIPNSVDTLAPNNRFVRQIQTFPIAAGIPYHVIVGDRGKGGNRDKTKPVMADGFVPYWSSHMDGAASELIVPSNHSVHQNPQAIAEVLRILKNEPQQKSSAKPASS